MRNKTYSITLTCNESR